jgi:acetyl esterase/lipase
MDFTAGITFKSGYAIADPTYSTFRANLGLRNLTIYRDIPYGAGFLQTTDWYVPDGVSKGLIIFFHGGGWTGGSKSASGFNPTATAYTENDDLQLQLVAKNGYAVINCNYRLSSSGNADYGFGGSNDGYYPNSINDVKTVVRNAMVYGAGNVYSAAWNNLYAYQVGVSGKVMVSGTSAGAHLAMTGALSLGVESNVWPKSILSNCGPMDLNSNITSNFIDPFIVSTSINPYYTTANIRALASPRQQTDWLTSANLTTTNTKFYFNINNNDTLVRPSMQLPFANSLPNTRTTINIVTEGPTSAGFPYPANAAIGVNFIGSTNTLPTSNVTLGDCYLYTKPGDVIRFWTYNAGTYAGDSLYPASISGFTPWFEHFFTTPISTIILQAADATL